MKNKTILLLSLIAFVVGGCRRNLNDLIITKIESSIKVKDIALYYCGSDVLYFTDSIGKWNVGDSIHFTK